MAFIIPLTILGSSISGFMAGYYYYNTNDVYNNKHIDKNIDKLNITSTISLDNDIGLIKNINDITTNDVNENIDIENYTISEIHEIKNNGPYKNIHDELITFKKENLKKTEYEIVKTDEQELMDNLRKKILNRRNNINPIKYDKLD